MSDLAARKSWCRSCGKRALRARRECAWCKSFWLRQRAWDLWWDEVELEQRADEWVAGAFGVRDIEIAEALVRAFWRLKPLPTWMKSALPYLLGGLAAWVFGDFGRRRAA